MSEGSLADVSLFDVGFIHNRKIRMLSSDAFRLWVSAIDHSKEQKTDGLVTARHIDFLPGIPRGKEREALIAELVQAGLWHPTGEGAWVIHDFLKHQSSAAEAEARRIKDRDRMRDARSRSRSANSTANDIANEGDGSPPSSANSSARCSPNCSANMSANGGVGGALPGFPPHPLSSPDQNQLEEKVGEIPEDQPENRGSGRARAARKKLLPKGWEPTPEHRDRASKSGLNFDHELERFRLHAEATGRRMVNWNAAFTTWLLNAPRFAREPGKRPRGPVQPDHGYSAAAKYAGKAR